MAVHAQTNDRQVQPSRGRIVACHCGKFIGIECKAGSNKPTALQERELNRILNAGGEAYVINEENIEQLREELIWNKTLLSADSS